MFYIRDDNAHRTGRQIPDSLLLIAVLAIIIGLLIPVVFKIREAANRLHLEDYVKRYCKGRAFKFRDITWPNSSNVELLLEVQADDKSDLSTDLSSLSALIFAENAYVQHATITVYRGATNDVVLRHSLTRNNLAK